jgi:hypothetical protein
VTVIEVGAEYLQCRSAALLFGALRAVVVDTGPFAPVPGAVEVVDGRAWHTAEAARAQLQAMRGRAGAGTLAAYQCMCGAWHVGNTSERA